MTPPTSDETRARIVSEAERLFQHYGYAKTTVADIASACGMSPANVYRFFSAKSEINNAICCSVMSALEVRLGEIVRMDAPAPVRLRALIETIAQNTAEIISQNKNVHEMVAVALEENWSAIHAHLEIVQSMILSIVASGIDKGEFRRQDPFQASRCVHFAVVGLQHPVVAAQAGDYPNTPTPAAMADFILSALMP
jgi:AcrR family transcriptional regulator